VGMSGAGRGKVMAEINVTPLVDVMLVLLIIFMVTAPMMNTAGVAVDLPRSEAPPMDPADEQQLVLTIRDDLTYYIGDNLFTADELRPKLAAIAAANPDQPVFLRADGEVAYKHVAGVLGAAKAAGIVRVGLVFEPGVGELSE
jgi:biopolymer transport protein TolR